MPQATFTYTAIDASGAKRNGVVEAASAEAAIAQLSNEGRFVLDIKEGGRLTKGPSEAGGSSGLFGPSKTPPNRQELALFSRRMADLADAGLPLDRVLQVIVEQTENNVLRGVAEATLEEVRGGMPVSIALAKFPKYFPEIYTQTLRAGEASGQFGEVASRLAEFQEKEVARSSQIVGALIYPAVLASTSLGVVILLVTFVIPKLSDLFKDMGGDLPVTTKMLLGGADFITSNWILCLGAIIGIVVGSKLYLATRAGRLVRDRFMLHAPVIGPVVQGKRLFPASPAFWEHWFTAASIFSKALEIAGLSAGNLVFQISAEEVGTEVRAGRPIADAMRDGRRFPAGADAHGWRLVRRRAIFQKCWPRVSDSLDFEVDNGMRRLIAPGRADYRALYGIICGIRRCVGFAADLPSTGVSLNENAKQLPCFRAAAAARRPSRSSSCWSLSFILAILAALIVPRIVGHVARRQARQGGGAILPRFSSLLQQ